MGTPAADDLWAKVAAAVRAQLSEATWNTWFPGVHALDLTEDTMVLGVPSSVAVERIRTSYLGLLADAVQALTGVPLTVELLVDTAPRLDELVAVDVSPLAPAPAAPIDERAAGRPKPSSGRGSTMALNPRYTFDQFVIGASNRFAHAAALSVAESPARSYNPLFIYGPAGLGKTHLLHAIGHHVRALFSSKRVRYVSTETMMNEFVEAMRSKTMPGFKRRYREVDVLLVDDIQFLERTEQLQEEFFYTFNDLHSRGSQIVISSDRPPEVDRHHRGPAPQPLRVGPDHRHPAARVRDAPRHPPQEGRVGAPRRHPRRRCWRSSPRTSSTTSVSSKARSSGSPRTRACTGCRSPRRSPREVLADLLPASRPRVITPELILEETAKMFGWTVEDLCGKSRRRPLVTARQIGMYVFRELTDYSYPKIAEEFGGRDHTTVMHACEKIRAQMAERRVVFEQVNELISRIKHGASG